MSHFTTKVKEPKTKAKKMSKEKAKESLVVQDLHNSLLNFALNNKNHLVKFDPN